MTYSQLFSLNARVGSCGLVGACAIIGRFSGPYFPVFPKFLESKLYPDVKEISNLPRLLGP